jgi:DNA-binding CsgD family transcriptional regulator
LRSNQHREVQSVSRHFSKDVHRLPSQISPYSAADVTSDMTLADTFVMLCDWHGRVVWKSGVSDRVAIGDEIWKYAAKESLKSLQAALARVVTLREKCTIEAESDRGDRFRFWMWPLTEPEIAVCILALRVPSELKLLTDRERACLECLAQGMSTRNIAERLCIGLTTVHTHLRHSREKLGLESVEALIGFAARYFFASPGPSANESREIRQRGV